ncbi:MAG: hypothetical protein E6X52_01120 [Actinomyces sp.]|uniref:hypothetical protein n=1 Tax=uncultured Actinomyces sp. TaxID=249061 RepID=UPI0028043FB3|nr:hypothetical protein [uncultured Actinomyces sp.]MDU4831133.1 hypothetical protein [Actinomyces sp.]
MNNKVTDQIISTSIGTADRASCDLRLLKDTLAPLGIVDLPDPIEQKRRSAYNDVREALFLSAQAAEQLADMHTMLNAPEQSMTPTDQAVYALEEAEKSVHRGAGKLWAFFETLENLNTAELPASTHDRIKTLTGQVKYYQGGLYTVCTSLIALTQELKEQDEK